MKEQSIPPIRESQNVKRLRKWLNYEVIGAGPVFLFFFTRIGLMILGVVAVVFLPVLIRILLEERRYGWIISLVIFVLLPAIGVLFVTGDHPLINILPLIPFFFFTVYCVLLKISINSWED